MGFNLHKYIFCFIFYKWDNIHVRTIDGPLNGNFEPPHEEGYLIARKAAFYPTRSLLNTILMRQERTTENEIKRNALSTSHPRDLRLFIEDDDKEGGIAVVHGIALPERAGGFYGFEEMHHIGKVLNSLSTADALQLAQGLTYQYFLWLWVETYPDRQIPPPGAEELRAFMVSTQNIVAIQFFYIAMVEGCFTEAAENTE